MSKKNDYWLIDSNSVGVIRFYKDYGNEDKYIDYMFVEEVIIRGIYGDKAPLMKTTKKMNIEEARLFWKNLIEEGWEKTDPKW